MTLVTQKILTLIYLFGCLFIYVLAVFYFVPSKQNYQSEKKAGSGSVLLILGRLGDGMQHHQWFILTMLRIFMGYFRFQRHQPWRTLCAVRHTCRLTVIVREKGGVPQF